jgi:hypothetical protein
MTRHIRWAAVVALASLAPACGELDEDTWSERYVRETCRFYEECIKVYFVEYHDDQAECIEDYGEAYEDQVDDYYDDCDFDPDKAEGCLESMKEASRTCDYDDIDDDCNEVWDCGDRNPGYYGYNYYSSDSSYTYYSYSP